MGFLCPAGHSLSGTRWCSPGRKRCWCSLDGWMVRKRQRQTEIRKSGGQTQLALWIIQHNPWDAARSLWKGRRWMTVCVSVSCNMDAALVSLPALGWPTTSNLSTACLSCIPLFHPSLSALLALLLFLRQPPLFFYRGCMPELLPIHIHWKFNFKLHRKSVIVHVHFMSCYTDAFWWEDGKTTTYRSAHDLKVPCAVSEFM